MVFTLRRVVQFHDGNPLTPADVVLLDLNLPDSSGLETLHRLRGAQPDVPILVLSCDEDETTGLRAVENGAQDYLVKGQYDFHMLGRALLYAIERQRAKDSLANHDALTALLNRRGLEQALDQELRAARGSGGEVRLVAHRVLDVLRDRLLPDRIVRKKPARLSAERH